MFHFSVYTYNNYVYSVWVSPMFPKLAGGGTTVATDKTNFKHDLLVSCALSYLILLKYTCNLSC